MVKRAPRPGEGRPSGYSKEILDKAKAYLDECQAKDAMPQTAQLAYQLNCSRKTLYNWAEANDEFLHILEKLNALQEFILISKGLSGDYNAALAKLVLGKHGYHDRQDITSGDKPLTPLLVRFLDDKDSRNTEGV